MKAYEVIEQNDWCQGASAMDASGKATHALSPKAVAFCAIGAMKKAYHVNRCQTIDDVLIAQHNYRCLRQCLVDDVGLDITAWNDTPGRTKDEVVDVLKRAEARFQMLRNCLTN